MRRDNNVASVIPEYSNTGGEHPGLASLGIGPGIPTATPIARYPAPPIQAHTNGGPFYPMQRYNGMTVGDYASYSNSAVIKDTRPYGQRRFNNLGYTDVQLKNGMGSTGAWNTVQANGTPGIMPVPGSQAGNMMSPYPVGQAFVPYIPGQTRDNVAGFHPRGPSPWNVQDIMMSGPGSQPEHPGGPGTVVGNQIYNPMSG